MKNKPMRGERWWWLAGFLIVSVLIHVLLALYGPGFGLKNGFAASPKEIELTLEPLPPVAKKAIAAVKPKAKPAPKMAKVMEKPKAPVKVTPKSAPKVAAVPAVILTPSAHPARTVTPEALPAQAEPLKMAAALPHFHSIHTTLPLNNPLAGLTAPDDQPQAAAQTDTPRLTRAMPSAASGLSGGGRSASHELQAPTEQPADSGLPGGMHFPRMAARVGGPSILSVNNPLAEDAVPDEKPGFSRGTGSRGGMSSGSQGNGMNGKLLASLRTGLGSGRGGGMRGGHGGGAGRFGTGRGTGLDAPGIEGDGYGRMGIGLGGPGGSGSGRAGGLRVASGGSGGAFGDVGGLLRGEPARTPGDGQAGRDGHGLSAEIYEGQPYLTTLTHHRTDAFIDFNWGTSAAIIHGVSRLFSVRWSGQIASQFSEPYTFVTLEDDGLRIWIDGKLVINDWHDHKPNGGQGTIFLEAGRKYDIKIEYFENGIGHAEVHMRWTSPSQPLEVVPESALWQAK